MSTAHRLRNRYLQADIGADGRLLTLGATASGVDGRPAVVDTYCRYRSGVGSFREGDGSAADSGFRLVSLDRADTAHAERVDAVVATPLVTVRRSYELGQDGRLLAVTCEVRGTYSAGPATEGAADRPAGPGFADTGQLLGDWQLVHTGFPHVVLGEEFSDAFEDAEDLYFDGEELGDGTELPCWRVFFRGDHQSGLLVATRSKLDMSRFQILARGFELRPHAMVAYDSHTLNPPLDATAGNVYRCRFELGPWQRSEHEATLADGALEHPVVVSSPSLSGSPPPEPIGVVFHAAELAQAQLADSVSDTFHAHRWMAVAHPCSVHGRALHAGPSVRPPPLTFDPQLGGLHRIYIGVCNGDGVTFRLSGDPEDTYRQNTHTSIPFHLKLSGACAATELTGPVADMTGQTLTLARFPMGLATTIVDYVRFEPLGADEARAWRGRRESHPPLPISGFNDIPDISKFTDARDPSPVPYRVNLWEHATAGVNTVYWRIDGQCSDYPSRHNTMRYPSARVHDIFNPHKKAYGRVLKKLDMLAYAVEAAREYGLTLYGWQRFNNYHGNVQSDFFRAHPEYWEEFEDNERGRKLCVAYSEVRRHKIDILVEAASYGLDGLVLGFLRHPPVSLYASILVDGYRGRYGEPPPRNPEAEDPRHLHTLPETTPEYEQWFRYRAEFMTQFGRELQAALAAADLGHVKVAIWVRPNHCLFDGIDLETWLEEGLCHEVVADAIVARYYHNHDVYDVRPEWKEMVQTKVPLIRGVSCFDFAHARAAIPTILADGYDGISIYESDLAVYDSNWIALFDWLRDGAQGEPPGPSDAAPTAG